MIYRLSPAEGRMFLASCYRSIKTRFIPLTILFCLLSAPGNLFAFASNNVPLDSPVYSYIEKLAGYGLITSSMSGIKPYSRAEAARLLLEAEENLAHKGEAVPSFANDIVMRMRELLPREVSLQQAPASAPFFDYQLLSGAKLRYVYLEGVPRSYERPVHDPGGDGVFGIGAGLRPDNFYPSPVQQHGSEATPLLEGNEGVRYADGSNAELRFSSEVYGGSFSSVLIEPLLLRSEGTSTTSLRLNKGYVKLGGGSLELEVGRDADWLGIGTRTAITLSNNPRNLDQVKLSSPEPLTLPYIGLFKYALIFSRLDHTITNGQEREPWFYALKLSAKPIDTLEIGFNLGRQQGGPGVSNSLGDTFRGLVGGSHADNSNSVAGFELRLRLPWLRNSELYGEFSGEDAASFWPIVESYVAGIYVPNLTADGRNEFRCEYYLGNSILSASSTFPEGYLYRGLNVGPFEGGASEQIYGQLTHLFSVRNRLMLDYFHTERGNLGRVKVNALGRFDPSGVMQAVERANAWRVSWNLPLVGEMDLNMLYGLELIDNFNLVGGRRQTNQLVKLDLNYRY